MIKANANFFRGRGRTNESSRFTLDPAYGPGRFRRIVGIAIRLFVF
jgi:hypothetical protein